VVTAFVVVVEDDPLAGGRRGFRFFLAGIG
jgi:hypothetical protein